MPRISSGLFDLGLSSGGDDRRHLHAVLAEYVDHFRSHRPHRSRFATHSRTVAAVIDWMFRNRRTGRLTVAQLPNSSLNVFLVVTGLRLVAAPTGFFRTALDVTATAALSWWAGDEVIRGVNPFRRMLGATVLAVVVIGLLR